jgi:hypothetical protein
MAAKWSLNGTYFEGCNCDSACPCVFLSAPTYGDCTVIVAWHIAQGKFENVELNGLNTVFTAYAPGHMMENKWKIALYVDDKASETQKNALVQIFSGQAGGHPAVIASMVGEVLGVKSAPIEYKAEGRRRSLRVANLATAEIEGVEGQGGAEVTVNNVPFAVVPGFPAVAAKSKQVSYKDYGQTWEISGKNGFYSAFAYQGG